MNERQQLIFKNGISIPYAVKKTTLIKILSKKQKKLLLPLFMHIEPVTFQFKVSDS